LVRVVGEEVLVKEKELVRVGRAVEMLAAPKESRSGKTR
jgi:hypothetical protein